MQSSNGFVHNQSQNQLENSNNIYSQFNNNNNHQQSLANNQNILNRPNQSSSISKSPTSKFQQQQFSMSSSNGFYNNKNNSNNINVNNSNGNKMVGNSSQNLISKSMNFINMQQQIQQQQQANSNYDQSNLHLTIYGKQIGQDIPDHISHMGNGFSQCSVGEDFAMLITSKGELYAMGNNQYGQLGILNVDYLAQPTLIPALKDIKISQVVCGSDYTFALTSKGEVYSWGLNLKGQLGLGNCENTLTPQLVYSLLPFGQNNSKAKKINENKNNLDQNQENSSIDNIMDKLLKLSEKSNNEKENTCNTQQDLNQIQFILQADEVVTNIACGSLHTLVLTNKNNLFSCGFGETFALGTNNTILNTNFEQIQLPVQREKIDKIACGLAHSACLVQGKVFMWGMISKSIIYETPTLIQFPQNTNTNIVDIKLGDSLSVFLNYKGEVFTLGDNYLGQLGNNNQNQQNVNPEKLQNLPIIDKIIVGRNYCIAISTDYENIFGWGDNKFGQITGQSSKDMISAPMQLQVSDAIIQNIECGSFQSIILSQNSMSQNSSNDKNNFLIQAQNQNRSQNKQNSQENNIEQWQAQQELQKYRQELMKIQQENEALKTLSTKILQKNEKLTGELQQVKRQQQSKQNVTTQTIPSQDYNDNTPDKKQAHRKNQLSKFEIQGVNDQGPLQHRIFNSQVEIDFKEINQGQLISEGGYGKIYKGKWRESTVAIKMFKIDGCNENTLKDFLSECHAMEALRHPNIVMFLGACTKKPNFSIILEFCKNGSLWGILQSPQINLSWERRRHIALDAAKGVHYLHMCNPPILHRDLKSLNLLLDESMRCKLADFGWTKTLNNYMTGKIGTYQWMAPEVISGQPYTEKADVFSFGIILWEIASRQPPYREKTGIQVSYEVLNSNLRPSIPNDTPPDFAKLIQICWDKNPDKRPTFYQIIKQLESIKLPSKQQMQQLQ